MRGTVGGRNHKTLLLVNGRVMNQRTIFGAVSERFLPMLGDIEAIEVVRGPVSAVYGSGAINEVVSIKTATGASRPGTEASFRQGVVEGSTLGKISTARQIGSKARLLVYYGIADYRGRMPPTRRWCSAGAEALAGRRCFARGCWSIQGSWQATSRWRGERTTRHISSWNGMDRNSGYGFFVGEHTT